MKKTTMMLAIMSAIIATGLAVSPTLATPVFAQSASTSGASTDFGSATSSSSARPFGSSSSSSGAGEDVFCAGVFGETFCDARR
jgi:outer membrane lipoprotein SlyB